MTDHALIWRGIERRRKKHENIAFGLFKSALISQVKPVYELLKDHHGALSNERIMVVIKPDAIREAFVKTYQSVGADFAKTLLKNPVKSLPIKFHVKKQNDKPEQVSLSVGVGLNDTNEAFYEDVFLNEMRRIALTEAGSRITSITNETKRQVLEIIRPIFEQGAKDGLSVADIAKQIENSVRREWPTITRWRAVMIARTETGTAAMQGEQTAAKYAEDLYKIKLEKKWFATPDDLTRDSHRIMMDYGEGDNGWIARDEVFNVPLPDLSGTEPMDGPCDPMASAGNTINCRCAILWRIKEKSKIELNTPEYEENTV
jgi:hypothetical protein